MSGHSKFANIKHKKEANDAAKGKIFTIIGREIAVAVKEGGPDPNNNFKLAQVIAKAKAADISGVTYQHNTYEGYGPAGVAIIVETLTDNPNRTAADVRAAFSKGNGNLGSKGSVSFMFDEKGQTIIDKEEYDGTADDLMMIVLDAGAEDVQEDEDSFTVLSNPDDFDAVDKAIRDEGIPTVSSEITMIPQNYVTVTDEAAIKGLHIILDRLDESDDVQNVYHNWNEEA